MAEKKNGLSRREVIVGGVTAAALASCEPAHEIDDELVPVAHWQEDPEMTAPAPKNLTQPLVLWGSVIAPPNADSPVPNASLMNPFENLPIEILEVRFRIYPLISTAGDFPGLTGMGVGVKMDLGKAPIIDAGVPLSVLGTVRDSFEHSAQVFGNPKDGTVFVYPTAYSWRLKYPLYVPPGHTPAVVVSPFGQNIFPVNVDVLYIARTWDPTRPQPSKVKVPWAASWQSRVFDYDSSVPAAFDTSPTLDMVNPFGVPLELQRITGRVSLTQASDGSVSNSIVEDPFAFRTKYSNLRLRSSRGFDLIRTPTAFNAFFPGNWRAWDVPDNWFMAPQEYYRAQLKIDANTSTVGSTRVGRAQFSMGVVGYRDVDVSSLEAA